MLCFVDGCFIKELWKKRKSLEIVNFCVFRRQHSTQKIKTENGVLDSINHEFGGFSRFDKIKNAKVQAWKVLYNSDTTITRVSAICSPDLAAFLYFSEYATSSTLYTSRGQMSSAFLSSGQWKI